VVCGCLVNLCYGVQSMIPTCAQKAGSQPASSARGIGADFHGSMVATAPGEKLLIRRRPVRKWTRRTISSLFCAENYICSQENQQKLLPLELHFLTPICPTSFVGLRPRPHWGAYSAPPDSYLYFGGLLLKGGEGNEGEGERRRQEGREGGSFSCALGGRKKSRRLRS